MTQILNSKSIFTEHDESLSLGLRVDPLGFQLIWTYFGQKIFKDKINSATFDIRNFNLNLFNHAIIFHMQKEDANIDVNKMIILLENILIWSWYNNQNTFKKEGLSGTSLTAKKWEDTTKVNLQEDLIKNQISSGINGRYKGAFIKMGFFNSDYKYDEEKMKTVTTLIEKNVKFKKLFNEMVTWFETKEKEIKKLPIKSYQNVFQTPQKLVPDTKDFWLDNLGFKEGDAAILYEKVSAENNQNLKDIFQKSFEVEESKNFKDILELEPMLAYINLFFNYLLTQDGCSIQEIEKTYLATIKSFKFSKFYPKENSSVKDRLEKLHNIEDIKTLIAYHEELMISRDRLPWIEIKDEKLKVLKIQRDADYETELKNPKGVMWEHDYYKGVVRRIKESLEV